MANPHTPAPLGPDATMADLIAYDGRKWLYEAIKIAGPMRCLDSGVESLRVVPTQDVRAAWLDAPYAASVAIPPIPYPDDAGLDWLVHQASLQGWGGEDFGWVKFVPAGVMGVHCVCHEEFDLPRRNIPLPNGQPSYVYAGQCPRCGVIYWGV